MASQKQIDANRRNAQKSTGPRTPEGKAKCSRNALKHGLASISRHAFLSVEDKSAFERMLHGYTLIHCPNHADEVDLVVDAVYCKWRQQRIWNTETTLVEMTMAEQQQAVQHRLPKADVAAHIANSTELCARTRELNSRYEAQLHRQYLRSLRRLEELQDRREGIPNTLDELYPDTPPSASTPTSSIHTPAAQTSPTPTSSTPGLATPTNTDRKGGDPNLERQSTLSPKDPPKAA